MLARCDTPPEDINSIGHWILRVLDREKTQPTDNLMVRSVEKAFKVMEAFDGANPELSLSQVASLVGLDKSAAQRFTHTLVQLGYLSKDPVTKRFQLGVRVLERAGVYISNDKIISKAMPVLLHLSKETEETVNMTFLDGHEIIFVVRFMSRYVLGTNVVIGTRLPAYCTAPGRAMLSMLPPSQLEQVLQVSDLKPYTSETIYEYEPLKASIAAAKINGYAVAWSEYYAGDLSIAAPLIDANGAPRAAINIGVSSARYSREQVVEKFGELIKAAAQSIAL